MGVLMRLLLLIVMLLMPYVTSATPNSILVVANTDSLQTTLTKSQVRELYMSGIASFENVGLTLTAVTVPPGNRARLIFNAHVIGLPESRIQSYWAQMQFSGRNAPPVEASNKENMLKYLQQNKGAVGYVLEGTLLPPDINVVYSTP